MQIVLGQEYDVTAIKFLEKGAIFEFEDGDTCFIHISQLADKFVEDVADAVNLGVTYTAKCIEGRVKPLELTLRKYPRKSNSSAPKNRPPKMVRQAMNNLDSMISKSEADYRDKSHGRDNRRRSRNRKRGGKR